MTFRFHLQIKVEVLKVEDGKKTQSSTTFRRELLTKCQREFEKDKKDDEERDHMLAAINDAAKVGLRGREGEERGRERGERERWRGRAREKGERAKREGERERRERDGEECKRERRECKGERETLAVLFPVVG